MANISSVLSHFPLPRNYHKSLLLLPSSNLIFWQIRTVYQKNVILKSCRVLENYSDLFSKGEYFFMNTFSTDLISPIGTFLKWLFLWYINATMTWHVIVAFLYHKNSRFKKVPIGLTRPVQGLVILFEI